MELRLIRRAPRMLARAIKLEHRIAERDARLMRSEQAEPFEPVKIGRLPLRARNQDLARFSMTFSPEK